MKCFMTLFALCLLVPGALIAKDKTPARSKWQLENAERKSYISIVKQPVEHRLVKAFVIPIEGEIGDPQLYILRRGLKDALLKDIDVVILKMDTPGGSVKTMLDMMEALDKFEGETITFIDDEAMSAGSFIAVACDAIYMHPDAIIGAAEPIMSTGQDIGEAMKRKLESYLGAKVRIYAKDHRYRGDVQRAMYDPDFEFKIDKEVIKKAGELLTLTADESLKQYGKPPQPLLADGKVEDIRTLLAERYGEKQHGVTRLELSWSEKLSKLLNTISPIIMGIAMLLIFIEFKTPGFGVFGVSGIVLFFIVFFGSYTAGLAGYETIIIFALGVVLLAVELFLFPGILVAGILGGAMMFGALLWSMADIWPTDSLREFNMEMFETPLLKLTIAIMVALSGAVLLSRVLPRSWVWDKIVLSKSIEGGRRRRQRRSIAGKGAEDVDLPKVGAQGISVTKLYPTGEVEIDGRRYLAKVRVDMLEPDTPIVVVGHKAFQLLVEPVETT